MNNYSSVYCDLAVVVSVCVTVGVSFIFGEIARFAYSTTFVQFCITLWFLKVINVVNKNF